MSKPPKTQQPPVPYQVSAQVTRQISGPLPAPAILADYNAIVPGAAERIIAMAEDNNRHFQTMDKMAVTATFKERRTGQWFGLVIGLASLGTCAYGFSLGHAQEAAWLGGTTIVALVSVFVVGRITKTQKQGDRQK